MDRGSRQRQPALRPVSNYLIITQLTDATLSSRTLLPQDPMFHRADLALRSGSADVPALRMVRGLHDFAASLELQGVPPRLQKEFLEHTAAFTRRQHDMVQQAQ